MTHSFGPTVADVAEVVPGVTSECTCGCVITDSVGLKMDPQGTDTILVAVLVVEDSTISEVSAVEVMQLLVIGEGGVTITLEDSFGVDSAGIDLTGVDSLGSAGNDSAVVYSAVVYSAGLRGAELVAGIVVPVASGAVQGTVP